MARAGRDDENTAPPDLRLVPGAVALWVGSLIVLLAGVPAAWWTAAVVLLAVLAGLVARPAGAMVWLPVAAFLLAGAAITGLRQAERVADPVTVAADQRSWAHLTGAVGGFPRQVLGGFTAPEIGPAGDQRQWRIPLTVRTAEVAGAGSTSTVQVAVLGTGPAWATLLPGQTIDVAGRLSASTFAGLPTISLTARDPPQLVDDASAASAVAGSIRSALTRTADGLDGDARGLLPGLVVGDTGGIDERLTADAKTTGVSHLLAVSGSHFAILCGVVIIVLRRFGPWTAAAGAALTLVGLVILVGPAPSVLRAAVMGGVGVLALFTGRTRSSLPALAAAAILLLVLDSDLALSAGFALSVLATAGLVLLAPLWSGVLQRRGVPAGWADLLAIPVAAQVVTMPVIVLISGAISVVGVPANLLVAPVVGPALMLGMLAALTGPWWPAGAAFFAQLAAPLLNWIGWVAHTLARWPTATVPWPATPVGAAVLVGVTVGAVLVLRRRWGRLLVIAVVVGVMMAVVPTKVWVPGWPIDGWLLVACEVGQGDALVLATGEPGTAIVVDTGPDPGLVDGCLDRLGIGTVALVVLTHLHADHVDGLPGVLDGRGVGAIAVGPGREPAGSWRAVNQQAGERQVPVVGFRPGDVIGSGAVRLTVLAPDREFHGTDSDPNNDSLVIMAEVAGTRILLTGDIEIEAQQALLNAGADLDADVLKVPHHGSADLLPRFVDQVSPGTAVIGVGADNDYGHPSAKALNLLAAAGVRTVLRTDTQGDVAVGVEQGQLVVAERGATLAARSP